MTDDEHSASDEEVEVVEEVEEVTDLSNRYVLYCIYFYPSVFAYIC